MKDVTRRRLLTGGLATVAGASGLAVAAKLAQQYGLVAPDHCGVYGPGETLTYAAQRMFGDGTNAREFERSRISSVPFANEVSPLPTSFEEHKAAGFRDWTLKIDGLVAHPLTLSVADLHRFPVKQQVTEVACEEGWSYIAEWLGTPLSGVMQEAGLLPQAKYVVYTSIDATWWDSLDRTEALHPQTLLTLGMNNGDLPTAFGGPLRLRVPRQLGYKSIKYITQITAVDSLKSIGKGLGSAGAEGGYSWYGGI